MALLKMVLLALCPAVAQASQVLSFNAQPNTVVAGEIPRLSISLLPASAIPSSGTITLAVPSTAHHAVFAATTPRNPFIEIVGSRCGPFLGEIIRPAGSTPRLVITLPANCAMDPEPISFDLPSDFLEANPEAGTSVMLQATTSADSDSFATSSYTTVSKAKLAPQGVAAAALANTTTESSESPSQIPEVSESPSANADVSESPSPVDDASESATASPEEPSTLPSPSYHKPLDPGFTPSPETSDAASDAPSASPSPAPSRSPQASSSPLPSASPDASASHSPVSASVSPSPSPGTLVVIRLDSTPSEININTTFSMQYVYEVPSINIGDNLTITFTCDRTTTPRSYTLLRFAKSDADSSRAVCGIPKYVFASCGSFTHENFCADATAAEKFQTLATGPGTISTTLASLSPSPTAVSNPSGGGSDTNLLYLLFLLFLIPVILVVAFFIWKASLPPADVPAYEQYAQRMYPIIDDEEMRLPQNLPPRVPPPTPVPQSTHATPTPLAVSAVPSPRSVEYTPLPTPYAIPSYAYSPQPLSPVGYPSVYPTPAAYPPRAAPMQQGMYSKGMDWWDRPAATEGDFSWA